MPNPESIGGMQAENLEEKNHETEKNDAMIMKEVTLELLKEIGQDQTMKGRAETYANRE